MKNSERVKLGVVGCGNISNGYLKNLTQKFTNIDVVACADLQLERARMQAERYGVQRACSVDDLLKMDEIEVVLNLTIPQAHFSVSMSAIEAGKAIYCEKPMCLTRDEAAKVLDAARQRGVRVGNAPDTFLGAGQQSCRKLLDDGVIGAPVSATAMILFRGHESWHPDPAFYYKRGGGPLFDMGVYLLTSLVALLGPVRRVCGFTRTTFPERVVTSEARRGERIVVETPTHIAGNLEFQSGAIGSVISSFDVHGSRIPRMEVHGTEGTLAIPEDYGAAPILYRPAKENWTPMPLTHPHAEESRGLGVSDFVEALRANRPHRCSGELAAHVLEIMIALHDSGAAGKHIDLTTTCQRPEPIPALTPDLVVA